MFLLDICIITLNTREKNEMTLNYVKFLDFVRFCNENSINESDYSIAKSLILQQHKSAGRYQRSQNFLYFPAGPHDAEQTSICLYKQ